jgi:hypothetical protein
MFTKHSAITCAESPSNDEESSQDERKPSSEDEIVKMTRNNLKRDHDFIMQTMIVFGTYFQTYYIKKSRRVPIETRQTTLMWMRHYFHNYKASSWHLLLLTHPRRIFMGSTSLLVTQKERS